MRKPLERLDNPSRRSPIKFARVVTTSDVEIIFLAYLKCNRIDVVYKMEHLIGGRGHERPMGSPRPHSMSEGARGVVEHEGTSLQSR